MRVVWSRSTFADAQAGLLEDGAGEQHVMAVAGRAEEGGDLVDVGDSRVYLFSGHQHKWYALTKDHNFLNEMAENGEIQIIVGQEYASFYYMLNYCFCADSQHEIPEFSPQEEYLTEEDALLICSDGVHDILECDTWQPLLAETSLKTWLMEMKNALYQHHAYDNVSMILIRLVQQGE
jgi:serine/threonine protein phosphatase PrpC